MMRIKEPLIPPKITNVIGFTIVGTMLLLASPILIPALAFGFGLDLLFRRFAVPYESEYSPWYAWRPVKTWGGYWVWLERIERRRLSRFDAFYQIPGDSHHDRQG